MKSAEDRLWYKNQFFVLGQSRILSSDSEFWDNFWKFPEKCSDIYETLTPNDIKTVRDQNIANFSLLLRVLSSRLIFLSSSLASNINNEDILQLLNCVRLLTKLLPFLFEHEMAKSLEKKIFWEHRFEALEIVSMMTENAIDPDLETGNANESKVDHLAGFKLEDSNPSDLLGVKLTKSVLRLLFINGFTNESPENTNDKLADKLLLWEPGVGMREKYTSPNPFIDSNRAEVLKMILVLVSSCYYESPSSVVSNGSIFMTALVSTVPKMDLLVLVCSLLNLVCRSSRSRENQNGLNSPNRSYLGLRYNLVTYSSQLLALMVSYPLPSKSMVSFLYKEDTDQVYVNMARAYVGKLYKEHELHIIISSLLNILKTPIVDSAEHDSTNFNLNLSSDSKRPSLWTLESMILMWELYQCNKKLQELIVKNYFQELFITLLYYVRKFHASEIYRSTVRLASYFMFYLSSPCTSSDLIFQQISKGFYRNMPIDFVIEPCPVTYRDFVLIHISNILLDISSKKRAYNNSYNNLVSTMLVEIMYNLIPQNSSSPISATDRIESKMRNLNKDGGLSFQTCMSIISLIARFSEESFLMENSFNSDLLALLIRAICTAMIKFPAQSRMLLVACAISETVFDDVWNRIYNLKSDFSSENRYKLYAMDNIEEGMEKLDNSLYSGFISPSELDESNDPLSSSGNDSSRRASAAPSNRESPNVSQVTLRSNHESESFENELSVIHKSLRPDPPLGMSRKARQKFSLGAPFYKTWGGNDSLRIILLIILPYLKEKCGYDLSKYKAGSDEIFNILRQIDGVDFIDLDDTKKSQISYDFLPETPLDPLRFNWSTLSLGWYLSLLFGNIFNSLDNVRNYTGENNILNNISTSLSTISKFTASWTRFSSKAESTKQEFYDDWVNNGKSNLNPWSQTSIKLFKIEPLSDDSFFGVINNKFGLINNSQAVPGTPGGLNEPMNPLTKRLNEFRFRNQSFSSVSSLNSGNSAGVEEEFTRPKYTPRNSVSSLHSLNTLNRSRTATPKNSISI